MNSKQVATSNVALEKRINREWAEPNRYVGFPAVVSYVNKWGHKHARCPVKDCKYDGLITGFNQHYARTHAPEQWRQHAKRAIKAVRS